MQPRPAYELLFDTNVGSASPLWTITTHTNLPKVRHYTTPQQTFIIANKTEIPPLLMSAGIPTEAQVLICLDEADWLERPDFGTLLHHARAAANNHDDRAVAFTSKRGTERILGLITLRPWSRTPIIICPDDTTRTQPLRFAPLVVGRAGALLELLWLTGTSLGPPPDPALTSPPDQPPAPEQR